MKLLAPLLFATSALASTLYTKPCYCGDSCETYEFDRGQSWTDGACNTLSRGMASFWVYDVSQCTLYNQGDCQGSTWNTNLNNQCFNSDIGWIWSYRCSRTA
ncbi:hypothetical protein FE257_011316 [Aspergillus nanangensis]|uniref:Uncharacterized protein n=1 Tax=Aspergillus nanangensis TaxID=2582783 RepID=A0AAD4GQP1_ASPNN|nr:hypothetical protein FE257_011316 [Aspergillus nanangensis]